MAKTLAYTSVHIYLKQVKGDPKGFPCVDCGKPAQEWSYDHSDPDGLVSSKGRTYSLDYSRYEARCVPCHRLFDQGGKCRAGHPWTEETAYEYRGQRYCRECRTEYMRKYRKSLNEKEN